MPSCNEEHPTELGVHCNKPAPRTGHEEHSGPQFVQGRAQYLDWPNEDYVPPPPRPGSTKGKLTALADRVKVSEDQLTVNRISSVDGASQEAAKVYARTNRKTRLGKVAEYLLGHVGEWVDAAHFADDEVGGFAGTRRLRELREE